LTLRTRYTTFTVRLDNQTSLVYGAGKVNVLAVRTDPSFGSGHWYEGGGINRPLKLVVAPHVHFVQGGVFASPHSDGSTLRIAVEVEDTSPALPNTRKHCPITLTLRDGATGAVVGVASCAATAGGGPALVTMTPGDALQTWSLRTPVSYVLTARVGADQVNVTVSVRTFDYRGPKAKLNGRTIELTGFSHHPSFAGMGAMTNPRLALFMVQTTKALGVNFWRNSHNPCV